MSQANGRRRNIFVLCLDDFHFEDLKRIPDRRRFDFHGLLEPDDPPKDGHYDIDAAIERAESILRDFDGPIDAIIGYWDFPVTAMVPILCAKFGLPAPSLEAVLKCAHKYWARVEQRRHIPEHTPDFCAVDPFAERPFDGVTLDFPFWLKPVCGHSSILGFRIDDRRAFDQAIEIARAKIRRFGEPFNAVLEKIDASDANGVDGNHMIAEAMIRGIELAPEGRVQHGTMHVHGVVDMVRAPNHKSFHAYRYPSIQPRRIQDRSIHATERLLRGIGYDNGCFNAEYFWNRRTDTLSIVEVNARVSQSHSNMMAKVDGMSNYEVAVHVGLGDAPHYAHGHGTHRIAAKFLHHRYSADDAWCVRAPSAQDLQRLRARQPDTVVHIDVREGMKLSAVADQDSYSWLLAELIIGGRDVHDLNRRFDEAVHLLPFEFEPIESAEAQPPTDKDSAQDAGAAPSKRRAHAR
jgi:biotin carboxylase